MTDAERFEKAGEIYAAALEIPRPERETYLHQACGGDPALLDEVRGLLGAEPEEAEEIVGNYRLIRELGSGGMGIVHLAERIDDYRQRVAIKRFRGEIASGQELLNRFRRERQILATLTHPSIVRLLDGGSTRFGRPYLVMEYVEAGMRLDAYCWEHGLPLRKRLLLFLDVCDAVAHAHQKLVVHRDLKPGNVLVTANGEVKLLDFGLAKAVDEAQLDEMMKGYTIYGKQLGTPGYASPEQLRGEPSNDVRTDVYALGAILFKLLTGVEVHRLERSGSWEEFKTRVCREDPRRASEAVSETVQTGPAEDVQALRRALRGDLDLIAGKALQRDRNERYARVEDLSSDVRAWLDGRPILARAPSRLYRAGKFVQRHKYGVAAGVLIAASLTGGITATLWQSRLVKEQSQEAERLRDLADEQRKRAEKRGEEAQQQRIRAEENLERVRQLAKTLIFDVHDQIKDLSGATGARQFIIRKGLEYLEEAGREAKGNAALQVELANGYVRIGDVQGRPAAANTGDLRGALASYEKAEGIAREASQAGAQAFRARMVLAAALRRGAEIWNQMYETDRAERAITEARRIFLQLRKERPAEQEVRLEQARADLFWGDFLRTTYRTARAEGVLREALREFQGLRGAGTHEELISGYRALSQTLFGMGRLEEGYAVQRQQMEAVKQLQKEKGEQPEGAVRTAQTRPTAESLERELQTRERESRADPRNFDAATAVAYQLQRVAAAYGREGNRTKSIEYYRRSVEMLVRLTQSSRSNLAVTEKLMLICPLAAEAERLAGEGTRAVALMQRAQALAEQFLAKKSGNMVLDLEAGQVLERVAAFFDSARGETRRAAAVYEKEAALYQSMAPRDAESFEPGEFEVFTRIRLSRTLAKLGERDRAWEAIERAVAVGEGLYRRSPHKPRVLRGLASALNDAGRAAMDRNAYAVAEERFDRARRLAAGMVDQQPADVEFVGLLSRAHSNLSRLREAQGRIPEAVESQTAGINVLQALLNKGPEDLATRVEMSQDLVRLAELETRFGKSDEALKAFELAVGTLEALGGRLAASAELQQPAVASWLALARFLAAQGRKAEAVRLIEEKQKRFPTLGDGPRAELKDWLQSLGRTTGSQ